MGNPDVIRDDQPRGRINANREIQELGLGRLSLNCTYSSEATEIRHVWRGVHS